AIYRFTLIVFISRKAPKRAIPIKEPETAKYAHCAFILNSFIKSMPVIGNGDPITVTAPASPPTAGHVKFVTNSGWFSTQFSFPKDINLFGKEFPDILGRKP